MSLRALYEQFLSSPNPLVLSDTATLHYVTTITSFTQPGAIIKHLENQNRNVVRKRSEKVLGGVEGHNSIALEVETTLEFISNGGSYLPGLDTFIIDHTAVLPITHFVHFDRDTKISQIRLSWDQGSLLKQVEVIGARGKNWPVYEGKDQIKIITRSSDTAAAAAPTTPPRGRTEPSRQLVDRSLSPTKKYIKDPHTSLNVFEQPKVDENQRSQMKNAVPPRESAKPPPREHSELFAAGHEDLEASPGGSPRKEYRDSVIPPKGGGNRRFEPSRLFEEDEEEVKERKIYKTNPARYNHFDLGDHDEADPMQHRPGRTTQSKHVPMVAPKNKSQSQWDFQDFVTPAKVQQKVRSSDAVHFSFNDEASDEQEVPTKKGHVAKGRKDAESHFEMQDDGTPVQRGPVQPKARKDANTHFDFRDDPTPGPRRIIARTKAAAGLYANNQIYDEEVEGHEDSRAALDDITNNAGRKNNLNTHWSNTDDSPPNERANDNKSTGVNQSRSAKGMDSHWDTYDQSPEGMRKQPGASNQLRKGLESHWSTGDEGTEARKAGRSNGRQQDKSFWDF